MSCRARRWPRCSVEGRCAGFATRCSPLGFGLAAEWIGRPKLVAFDAAAGFALLFLGLMAWSRRPGSRAGAIMSAAGFAWFLGTLWPPAVFWHRGLLAQLLISYPRGRLSSRLQQVGTGVAQELHASHPGVGVLVLSHFLESHYAMRLIQQHPGGAGYLLKERVSGVGVLADALARVHDGECVIDPTIVSRLLGRARPASALAQLTERERQVLALMAEGRSNRGICEQLFLGAKTVEGHVTHIFTKLGVGESADDHRRVLAVLSYLRSAPQQQA